MTHDLASGGDEDRRPWWTSVSPRELAASSELISGLLNPERDAANDDATALARALVLQQLFAHETLLRDLLMQASERSGAYSRVDATADLTEANAWLKHCALLEEVFGQSIEMLGSDGLQARMAPFNEFVMHVVILRRHLIGVEMSKGIGRDIPAPPPATFRRRGPI